MREFKAIFWDFDGVIKDSLEVKSQAFYELFLPFGLSIAHNVREHHRLNMGVSRFQKMPIYMHWAGISTNQDNINYYCNKFGENVFKGVMDSPWVPGVERYLRECYLRQTFSVISATPQQELECILKALNIAKYFVSIHGSPVTKTEAIKKIISRFHLNSKECLMIGDAMVDLVAANENNINFLARLHQHNSSIFTGYNINSITDFSGL